MQIADTCISGFRIAVGMWYERFGQTTDDEVRELLGRARLRERLAG